jgi:hypothetical protein
MATSPGPPPVSAGGSGLDAIGAVNTKRSSAHRDNFISREASSATAIMSNITIRGSFVSHMPPIVMNKLPIKVPASTIRILVTTFLPFTAIRVNLKVNDRTITAAAGT